MRGRGREGVKGGERWGKGRAKEACKRTGKDDRGEAEKYPPAKGKSRGDFLCEGITSRWL